MTRYFRVLGGDFVAALPWILMLSQCSQAWAGNINDEPISYAKTKDENSIARLQENLRSGDISLEHDEKFGYLPALLKALKISTSSQTLVFSKTSLQLSRIGPRTPRAIYFNDDVFVGYCHRGEVLEVTAADPKLGAVFYTLKQDKEEKPQFLRQTNQCLLCHGNTSNQGIPGHVVMSVYPESDGQPNRSLDFLRVDHSTPFRQRWGGWYVTGTTGRQVHLGNFIVRGIRKPDDKDLAATSNLTKLDEKFRAELYLTPHSDVVALMVMEHQTEMHNRLTLANFSVRRALFEQAEREKEKPQKGPSAEMERQIRNACEPVVRHLLFVDETRLIDAVKGTTPFAKEFAELGPRDVKGRSLRDFDLERRLFKFPCSYMIYSEMFDTLPDVALDYIYRRLWDILDGRPGGMAFDHLSEGDRLAIREILRATKPTLPAYWKSGGR